MDSLMYLPDAANAESVGKVIETKHGTPTTVFSGVVPDFVSADFDVLLNCRNGQSNVRKITDGLIWLAHLKVIQQRCEWTVTIRDTEVAQAIWGAEKPPRNWHRLVKTAFKEFCDFVYCSKGTFDLNFSEEFMRFFVEYRIDDPNTDATIDLNRKSKKRTSEQAKAIKQAWRERKHRAVYYPLELFGHTRSVGLSERQMRMLRSITLETTYPAPQKAKRATYQAAVIKGGLVPSPLGAGMIECPFFEKGKEYVGFNGNGKKCRGKGYRIFGARGGGWMKRFGYDLESLASNNGVSYERKMGSELYGSTDDPFVRDAVLATRRMLSDLTILSERFSLVVGAVMPGSNRWEPVSELLNMLATRHGRCSLNWYHLRIYAPADYLAVWRAHFAERLGFTELLVDAAPLKLDAANAMSLELSREMKKGSISQSMLAIGFNMSKATVSYYLSGKRAWSNEFKTKVEAWLRDRRAVVGEKVNMKSLSEALS